jgi:hypothetical protein
MAGSVVPLVAETCEAFIVARRCKGGHCAEAVVELHGAVYHDGGWVLAFHAPDDPLQGRTCAGDDPREGALVLSIWEAMTASGITVAGD